MLTEITRSPIVYTYSAYLSFPSKPILLPVCGMCVPGGLTGSWWVCAPPPHPDGVKFHIHSPNNTLFSLYLISLGRSVYVFMCHIVYQFIYPLTSLSLSIGSERSLWPNLSVCRLVGLSFPCSYRSTFLSIDPHI